jgi:hypothetical protein
MPFWNNLHEVIAFSLIIEVKVKKTQKNGIFDLITMTLFYNNISAGTFSRKIAQPNKLNNF